MPATPPLYSLDDLLICSDTDFERAEIARLNLSCAVGLPGAEELDLNECLATLDRWSAMVQRYQQECRWSTASSEPGDRRCCSFFASERVETRT
jgi:hypothetical protein